MKDISIIAVGGYNEIGRNMTAIRIGKDIVVKDMGIRLDRVQIHEDTDVEALHAADLINMGAIPDDSIMEDVDGKVRAIACTHGHLDHIGAISKLAHKYHAPIIASPFTADLFNQEIKSEKVFGVNNPLKVKNAGERFQVTEDIELEFIRVQHSIVDCVFAAIHTPKGIIVYANDFKIDRSPTLGEPPDFARLRALGKQGVLALITETTNASVSGKTAGPGCEATVRPSMSKRRGELGARQEDYGPTSERVQEVSTGQQAGSGGGQDRDECSHGQACGAGDGVAVAARAADMANA